MWNRSSGQPFNPSKAGWHINIRYLRSLGTASTVQYGGWFADWMATRKKSINWTRGLSAIYSWLIAFCRRPFAMSKRKLNQSPAATFQLSKGPRRNTTKLLCTHLNFCFQMGPANFQVQTVQRMWLRKLDMRVGRKGKQNPSTSRRINPVVQITLST